MIYIPLGEVQGLTLERIEVGQGFTEFFFVNDKVCRVPNLSCREVDFVAIAMQGTLNQLEEE